MSSAMNRFGLCAIFCAGVVTAQINIADLSAAELAHARQIGATADVASVGLLGAYAGGNWVSVASTLKYDGIARS